MGTADRRSLAQPAPNDDPSAHEPAAQANAQADTEPAGSQEHSATTPEDRRLIDSWDTDLATLERELRSARRPVRDVPVPATLTATQLLHLAEDPDGFAEELARPMPRAPHPAARRGTRFHAWVESRFDALTLPTLGPDELPGGSDDDPGIADERDLAALKDAFEHTPYAHRTPHRVEAPFQLELAGRVIRGRIDAVYEDGAGGYELVDWKTGRARTADPLQLAVYRLAWAEQRGVEPAAVKASFLYVRTGEVVTPPDLPGRPELEALLRPQDTAPQP